MTRLLVELQAQICALMEEASRLNGIDRVKVENQIKARQRIIEQRLYHGATPTSRPKQTYKPHPAWRYSGRHR
jgi:hypothetical protein